MNEPDALRELLLRWQDLHADGKAPTAEDLCATCPDLAPKLRDRINAVLVILYQILTGELPFRGSRSMMIFQVMHEEPSPPRKVNDRIPRDLETICLKPRRLRRATAAPRSWRMTCDGSWPASQSWLGQSAPSSGSGEIRSLRPVP